MTNSSARAWVRASVSTEPTSSTSGSSGTGLKKWMPTTWLARDVARASRTIGTDDVFDARIAS